MALGLRKCGIRRRAWQAGFNYRPYRQSGLATHGDAKRCDYSTRQDSVKKDVRQWKCRQRGHQFDHRSHENLLYMIREA